jgi:hypothetical protein
MPPQNLDGHALKMSNMEPTNIVSNNSHQELMHGEDECDSLKEVPSLTSISVGAGDRTGRRGYSVSAGQWLTIIILCYVNLINYMDRYTIAGKNFYFSCWLNTGYDLFRSHVGLSVVVCVLAVYVEPYQLYG